MVEGDNRAAGHVITAVSGSGASRQTYNYATERVVGNGSFGVVIQATCLETAETVRGWMDQGDMVNLHMRKGRYVCSVWQAREPMQ